MTKYLATCSPIPSWGATLHNQTQSATHSVRRTVFGVRWQEELIYTSDFLTHGVCHTRTDCRGEKVSLGSKYHNFRTLSKFSRNREAGSQGWSGGLRLWRDSSQRLAKPGTFTPELCLKFQKIQPTMFFQILSPHIESWVSGLHYKLTALIFLVSPSSEFKIPFKFSHRPSLK